MHDSSPSRSGTLPSSVYAVAWQGPLIGIVFSVVSDPSVFPQELRTYRVMPSRRGPTVEWLVRGLEAAGCRILSAPAPNVAPFKIIFETREGERVGAIFYLFTITCVATKNRPTDECRFQLKYGKKDGQLHALWQDPTGLYTTVFLGIEAATGCWVAYDPVLHSPTRMFISLEFKEQDLTLARANGWHVWERETRIEDDMQRTRPRAQRVETLVGGRPERILDLVRFERAAKGLDQGNRHLLADNLAAAVSSAPSTITYPEQASVSETRLHELAREFEMSPDEILTLIAESPRLKMAVRGWVAEDHLRRVLEHVPGVSECERLNLEGRPDIRLRFRGRGPIFIECKNVLRTRVAGLPRVDFQRTRASQGDPCSRYYQPTDFNVLAACMHALTERWEFMYRLPRDMAPHKSCVGRLSNLVRVDEKWDGAEQVLAAAIEERT